MVTISAQLYKKALTGPNTYEDVRELAGTCKAIKKDHFSPDSECVAASILGEVNAQLGGEFKANVEYEDHDTTEIIMSAFLKMPSLEEGESDLTGDSGALALKILGSEKVREFKGYIVDIGGQDSSFVKKFPNAEKRVVMDINALAWALDKSPEVVYALGSADKILGNSRFISEEQRPETIFTMSNFINVLSPEVAWHMLDAAINRMKSGDTLVITNLRKDHFFEEKNNRVPKERLNSEVPKTIKSLYSEGRSELGIHEFNKKRTGEHYKSTMGDDFVPSLKYRHPEVELVGQENSNLNCKIHPDKSAFHLVKLITFKFIKK
ncbi:MAG: hypothetical protein JSS09_02245 [Verrucomicrobia bacterium]|nr:hypothetical protein [Verrucomicrobiota bacterium]